MLAGAAESFQTNQGAFQEMDQVAFLKRETKYGTQMLRQCGMSVSLLTCFITAHQIRRPSALARQDPDHHRAGVPGVPFRTTWTKLC
jgi:hypothetical protein